MFRLASHAKTAAKTVSWRLFGALDTFALSFFLTGKVGAAGALVALELATKSIWFYGHERIWESSWVTKFFGGK